MSATQADSTSKYQAGAFDHMHKLFDIAALARAAGARVFALEDEEQAISTDASTEIRRLLRVIDERALALAAEMDRTIIVA